MTGQRSGVVIASTQRCSFLAWTASHRSFALLSVLFLQVLAACDTEPDYDARAALPGFPARDVEDWGPDAGWSLEPVREYGEADGDLAFGFIIGVAANFKGQLAVADYQSCVISLIGRPEGDLLKRIGGCGDGPAEFRRIRSLAYMGDSLLVYDQGRGDIAILDTAGTELSRLRVELPLAEAVWSMSPLEGSRILIAVERATRVNQASPVRTLPVVGVFNLVTGEVEHWVGSEPVLSTLGTPNSLRRMAACARLTQSQQIVVLFNSWIYEGIAVTLPDQKELFHFVAAVPIGPKEQEDGSWRPGGMATAGVWCGESGALFRNGLPRPATPGRPVRAEQTFLELRSYGNDVLMRHVLTDRDESVLHGGFGVMHGDTLFVSGTGTGGFPVVGEFHVTRNDRL